MATNCEKQANDLKHCRSCGSDGIAGKIGFEEHRGIIRTFKSRYNKKRRWFDRFADILTERFGTVWFFIINLSLFVLWVLWNSELIPWLPKFDPYPHNFLTMIVSLEAIFLTIIVLISQNRQSKIADMREEIDFNVNVRAEREITKMLNILEDIQDKLGIEREDDQELKEMERETDLDQIEKQIAGDYATKDDL